MLRNRKPPTAANTPTAVTEAPANGTERKKRISTSGSRRRSSYSTSPTKQATEQPNRISVDGEVQPARGASMIP